jgi:hypothetical protein
MASRPTALGDPACADACRMSILRVAADGTVVAVDPASGAVSYAGALGLGFDGIAPVAVDATRAVFTARRCDGTAELRIERTVPALPARLAFVPCPVRVLTRTVTLRRGRRSARLPLRCPRGCDEEWDLEYRGDAIGFAIAHAPAGGRRATEVSFENLRPLRHARRITATLGPDPFVESTHPRAEQQARIRVTVRLRG